MALDRLMSGRHCAVSIMVAVCLACGSVKTTFANLIDTKYGAGAGSFELGTFTPTGTAYQWLVPTDTTITGWTVGDPGDGVDWIDIAVFQPASGSRSVDLQHTSNSSISTTIDTLVGTSYLLKFATATVRGFDDLGTVSAGSLVNQPFSAPLSPSFGTQTFQSYSFPFVAQSSSTTVTFAAAGNSLDYGPVIDDVSVGVIPEPASLAVWALLMTVTMAVLGRRHRRT